ncbi:MAG: molybdopterin molybdotransferase MoeA [Nitrospirae bacterium]|nr:molybdopterin molybdotransferase MoeA [Nitrospirota bacterium]
MNSQQNDAVAEALKRFFDAFPSGPLGIEEAALSECNRRIVAVDVKASTDSPPFSRALVEGYLVNVADTASAGENKPVTLAVTGTIEPGKAYAEGLASMTCMELSTGGLVPEGEYAVVRHMDIVKTGTGIIVKKAVARGENVESKAYEHKKGDVIIRPGTKLSPKEIMLLAGQGVSSVTVSKKPVVAIFSTGTDILRHSEPLKPGYVWDVNSYTLAALVEECGGMPMVVDIMRDDFTAFQKTLRGALTRADMAVISGGTAAGGREFIAELINSIDDPGVVVNGVPMKSGKPLIMGVLSEKPVVCVAGYPPEAIRGFELFGIPAISRLLGQVAG